MAEPRIQYAQTTDGVSIAFCVMGEGPPLVHITPAFPHLQLEWQIPKIRAWYERLAQRRKLIRYDGRGMGLSQHEIPAFSPETGVLDLEAVLGRLELDRVALLGPLHGGPTAITYAARNPERVSHLVLWCTYSRAADWAEAAQIQASRALIDRDWDTYAETAAHLVFGWSAGDEARAFATLIRESTTPEAAQMGIRALSEVDVTALMPQVQSPTLVLHRRGLRALNVDVATGLASLIPHARLAILEGTALMPYLEDMEAVATAIDEFLGEGQEAAPQRQSASPAVHTVLFTDIEGSTALTQRLGDARAQEVLRIHNTIVRDALKAHSGSETKHTGDGIMASFASASRALECAIDIQRGFAQHSESNPDMPVRVRIGLNAGEPVAEEEDLFGTAVQLAARVCAHAEPGQVLLPEGVRHLVAGKRFLFADIGEIALRGFEDPVRLFEVRWREEG